MTRLATRLIRKDGKDYPPATFRVAVVQIEPIHEDVLPAVVHLLRLNGGDPTLYLNEKIRLERPGFRKRFPELAPFVRFVPLNGRRYWRQLAHRIRRSAPDLMVMNTFQFDAPSGWATWWDGPMLGIVHNPDRMRQAPQSMELVSAGRIGLLTLAPFVTTNLMQSDPVLYARVATITMAFPFPPRVAPRAPRGRTRVAIPGAVHFSSRDYEQILDALPRVLDEVQPDSFDICIVGGGPDRPQLEQLVAARDAAKYIRFAGLNRHGYVAGNAFYGLVRGSDFVLPNPTPEDMMYRSARITATIPTTVGLGIPTILDRWTATVYGVPAVSYPVGGLADGLVEALTMSAKDRKALEADLAEHRVLELHRASAEMAFALRSLGIRV